LRAAAVTAAGVAALVAAAAPGCSRQLLLLLRVGGGRRRDLWRAVVPGAETVAVAGVVACMVQGEASRCCGRLCLGASTWRADPGHGGLEMGSADICVRVVGMEEKMKLRNAECLPMSQGLKMTLNRHGFDVKPEMVKHEIILVACLLLDCDYIKDVKNCIPLRLAGEHIKDVSGIKSEGWDLRPL